MPMPRTGDENDVAHSITSPELGPSVWPTNSEASGEQQEGDGCRHFLGLAEAAERQFRGLGLRQSSDSAMTSGVLIGPGATALTRTPSRAHFAGQRLGHADDGGLGAANNAPVRRRRSGRAAKRC